MARYLLIESRDPFEFADTNYMYDLAGDLSAKGNNVTLFLVQNGVFCARRNVKDNPVDGLRQNGGFRPFPESSRRTGTGRRLLLTRAGDFRRRAGGRHRGLECG